VNDSHSVFPFGRFFGFVNLDLNESVTGNGPSKIYSMTVLKTAPGINSCDDTVT
jgi:hypothetical protein